MPHGLSFVAALAPGPAGLESLTGRAVVASRDGKAGLAGRVTVGQDLSRASIRKAVPRYRPRQQHAAMSEVNADSDRGRPKGAVVRDIRIKDILRPLAATRTNDPEKVLRLMDSIAKEGQKTPIDVLEVEGRYYGFSGCHRFEACQRLGQETISCRVFKATREVLQMQMM
jgi:sulfiredoxin